MNNKEVANLIAQIARIRNVDITYVCEVLRMSIIAGLKRRFGPNTEADVAINPENGEIKVFLIKKVVERVTNPGQEASLEEAKLTNPTVNVGDVLRVEMPLDELGRIAIRKASDELMLKLREAERDRLYQEYSRKKGEIATGTIQRIGEREIIVNLGLIEATLLNRDQLKTDHYRQGLPIKAYVYKVEKTPIGPRVYLSRTHPEFLRKLLTREVPEIKEGLVEIKAIARAPGFRSKVAVASLDEKIDPIGACVGYRKSRIENIIKELSGEKIDIIQWSRDIQIFIARALGPAKVSEIIREGDTYIVVVPDAEYSIAIGKKGQNVWLAGLLTNTKIEVLKETDYRNRQIMNRAAKISLKELGFKEEVLTKLQEAGLSTAFDFLNLPSDELIRIAQLSDDEINALKEQTREKIWSS